MNLRTVLIWLLMAVWTTWPQWAKSKSTTQGLDAEFIVQKESKQHVLPQVQRPFESAPTAPSQTVPHLQAGWERPFPAPLAWKPIQIKTLVLKARPPQALTTYNHCVTGGLGNAFSTHFLGCIQGGHLRHQTYTLYCLHNAVNLREEGRESANLVEFRTRRLRNLYRLVCNARYQSHDVADHLYRRVRLAGSIDNEQQSSDHVLRYRCSGRFRHLITPGQRRESQLKISGSLERLLDETFILKATSKLWLTKYTTSDQPHRNLWTCSPVLFFNIKSFHLHTGAQLSIQTPPKEVHRNGVSLYPIAEISRPFHAAAHPYLSLSGRISPNFLHNLALQNRRIVPDVSLLHTHQPWRLLVGSRGQWQQSRYDAGFAWEQHQNAPLFVQSMHHAACSDVVYEAELTTSTFFAETGYNNTARTLHTHVRIEWNHYNLKQEDKAWYKPTYRFCGEISYTFREHILLEGSLDWMGGMEAPTTQRLSSTPLDDWIDVNLGVNYKWTTRLSLFMRGLNILARANQRYLHDPWRGLRCMAGLSYSW